MRFISIRRAMSFCILAVSLFAVFVVVVVVLVVVVIGSLPLYCLKHNISSLVRWIRYSYVHPIEPGMDIVNVCIVYFEHIVYIECNFMLFYMCVDFEL